eukprot:m.53694 g.53694  ORF g.53694 m.53694 type:complete len:1509 (-) comp10879_c0_seq1:1965-6491(-)
MSLRNFTFCGDRGLFGKDISNPNGEYDWHSTFDFTTCFEESVVVAAPVAFIFFAAIIKLPFLLRNPECPVLRASRLFVCKQLLTILITLICMAELGDAIWNGNFIFQIVSPCLRLFGFFLAVTMLHFEHSRGERSSKILGIFWLLTLMVEIVRLRTTILKYEAGLKDETIRYVLGGGGFLLTFFIFVLSMFTEPPNFDEGVHPCPENSAGLLSIVSFSWLNPIMVLGYKKPLEDEDLFALNEEDQAPPVRKKFQAAWQEQLQKKNPSLVRAFRKAFGVTMYAAGFFKLVQDILAFVQPQILKAIIRFVTDQQTDKEEPQWHGFAYAGAMFATAFVQSIFLHQYFHRVYKTGMRLRSATMTAVYEKALVLSNTARQDSTTGEIVNLMAVDAQRFMDVVTYLHMLWSAPFQIALSLYFLYDIMGASVFAGLGVMILLIPVNTVIAKWQRKYSQIQMKLKDERIKNMNEVIGGIKVLKLYAWERPFANMVRDIRHDELDALKKNAYIRAVSTFSWTIAPFFVSLATFISYTYSGNNLTPEKAFVALSLFNLLRFPLVMLPMLIASIVQAQVSMARVVKFLRRAQSNPNNVQYIPVPRENNLDATAVHIQDGLFSWTDNGFNDTVAILSKINMKVSIDSLTAIVGPVGCGKSSLLNAVLGNMEKLSGTVRSVRSVAYVPQQAWIQNATLRDNIIFHNEFDAMRYEQVLRACALLPDLAILPAGDLTEIGEKGINLSGGQKQRVSLARAVYSQAKVYLLDDPLSAVDAHVGKHIFERVLGPNGLLKGKCRVLVTHALQYLEQCNHIYVMTDGTISESGSYENLMTNGQAFCKLIEEFSVQAQKSNQEESESPELARRRKISEKSLDDVEFPIKKKPSQDENLSLNSESTDEKAPLLGQQLIKTETTEKGAVLTEIYKKYTRALGYKISTLIVVMYCLAYAAQIGTNKWLAIWSEHEIPESDDDGEDLLDKKTLGMYMAVYGVLGLAYSGAVMAASIALALGSINASEGLHTGILDRVMRAPMQFFDTTPLGRIVNRFSQDIYTIDELIPRTLSSLVSCFGQVLSTVIVIAMTTPLFLVAVIPLGFLYYFIQKYYIATSRQLKRLESVSRSPIYAHFSETLSGVATIKAYGVQQLFKVDNENKVDFNLQAYYPSISANRWLAMRLEFLGNIVIFFAALFAVNEADNSINAGDVGLSLTYAMMITQTLNWMVRMATELETNIVAVERVDEYTKINTERPAIMHYRPGNRWPDHGKVVFENLGVRYREGLDLVLKNINCDIEPGEKVGVVGRTGAGKSSLMIALFNLIEPANGKILIDGEDISRIGLEDLRSKLTIMPQDAVLFAGTVRSNIDPFDAYDDETLWEALDTSHLKEFIKSLPNRLQDRVVEGGDNFSAGQRQLLCLARAVLRKTKVLVLDEATAACDAETDEKIQKTIRSEFAACTVLTIAHRIKTIMDSDKIMVLEKGKIIEYDTPQNLIASRGSFFDMAKQDGVIDESGRIRENEHSEKAGESSEI